MSIKLSFGEVNRFYGLKFCFYCDTIADPKNVICNHKTDNLPPKMTIFNMVVPILMLFLTFSSFNLHYFAQEGTRSQPMKVGVT